MGRFTKEKRFDMFVRAIYELNQMGVNFKAKIAGDGCLLPEIKKLSDTLNIEIEFCGWVEDKWEFLYSADIFCLNSQQEGFGLVVVEAMATKCAVVATKTEGPSEIIQNGTTGFLVEINSPQAMALQIKQLIDNPKIRHDMQQSGRKLAEGNYSKERVFAIIKQVFTTLDHTK